MKEVEFEESWNKKRILIAFIFIAALGLLAYVFRGSISDMFPKNRENSTNKSPSSKEGVLSTKSEANIEETLGKQIESIKKEAGNINLEEIASSSAQIQKIINDVKSLQDIPKNEAKDACFKICSGL